MSGAYARRVCRLCRKGFMPAFPNQRVCKPCRAEWRRAYKRRYERRQRRELKRDFASVPEGQD
ncbi:MAG: hypothetical protein WC728_03875 [Elusimicrobiota bacterium]